MEINFRDIAEFSADNQGVVVGPLITSPKKVKEAHVVFKPSAQKVLFNGMNSEFVKTVVNRFYPLVELYHIKQYQVTLKARRDDQTFLVHLFDGNLQYRLDKEFYLPAYGSLLADSDTGFFFSEPLLFSKSHSSLFTKHKI